MFGYFSRRCAVVLFSACVFLISAKAEAAEERKPNVVLIVADDKYEALKAKSPFMRQNAGNYG